MISLEEKCKVFRGKKSQQYIGVSPEGNIVTYETNSEKCIFTEESITLQENGNDDQTSIPCFQVFQSKCYPCWCLGVTRDGRACAMPVPDKLAGGSDVKYIEIDLDGVAPLGCCEDNAFKGFEVNNTLHKKTKKGIYWQYLICQNE